MKKNKQDLNVFGHKIEKCSLEPLTGAYRDGCCNTGPSDYGTHSVCAVVDDKFLRFSKLMGNDLVSDNPKYNFKGLKPGDKWCLCVFPDGFKPITLVVLQKLYLNQQTLKHLNI